MQSSWAGAAPSYRYTLDGSLLTPEQRAFYEEQGYLVVRGLVAPELLETFRERFQKICRREIKVCDQPFSGDRFQRVASKVAGHMAFCSMRPKRVGLTLRTHTHTQGPWDDSDERCGHCKE